eukprot:TRINITY_DN36164_c0_g1_i1.p1 TRINITY_DN36164_c0_g1~~TRINITY_DN36164_c0_g1_i1.p1  ORF type:complete len:652 (+),score=215.41 TRINITY_DN36164_c0_g1_i1:297-2252(+)
MLLWCGLDEAVVSKVMADDVLKSHEKLVRSLGQWSKIHADVKTLLGTPNAGRETFNESEWLRAVSRVVADYPSVEIQTQRHEAASLCALRPILPMGWSALVAGADLVGSHRAGDTIDVALLTGQVWDASRLQQLDALRESIQMLHNLKPGDVTLSAASDGTPQIVVHVKNPPAVSEKCCWVEVPQSASEASLNDNVQRIREAGVSCVRMALGLARVVVFDNPALATIALNNGFGDGWGSQCRFMQCPPSLCKQRIVISFAESLAGGALPYRAALLLRHYLCGSPSYLTAARLLMHWVRHHQLTQYISDYALLTMLSHYLLLTGQATFLDPVSVSPLDICQPLIAPQVTQALVNDVAAICKSFLAFFTSFDWGSHVVSLSVIMPFAEKASVADVSAHRKTLLREVAEHRHTAMWVCDPYSQGNLLFKVSEVRALYLKGLFAACSELLRRGDVDRVFGCDIGRSQLTFTSNVDAVFGLICGDDALPLDVQDVCFVEVSSDGTSHAMVAAAPAPPSPSYAPRTVLAVKPEAASIRDILAQQGGIWDESPGMDPSLSPATPSPQSRHPRAALPDGKSVDPNEDMTGSFISVGGEGRPHASLLRRAGSIVTPLSASPLPPLLSPGMVSPCSFLNNSFGFPGMSPTQRSPQGQAVPR